MLNYKQNNPRWNRLKIRGTELRVGMYGCLICCLASLSSYFGQNIGVQGIIDTTGFTKDGNVILKSGSYQDFEYDFILKGFNLQAIIDALNDPDRAVILGLNNAKHWVVACDIEINSGNLIIADPLGKADRTTLGMNDVIDYMAFFKQK